MSSKAVVLALDGLGKSYTIRHNNATSSTLGEALMTKIRRPMQKSGTSETFWAVKNVSAEIHQGDVVGVIGRNGAGKSTLLKLLSRITEPTTGEARLYGRVGSLLEVGTGFHPELTGRENIYLNGAILGMSRREIATQFDAIVDFSQIAQFLDTPVKRYSSGMYVRLAFAVAAHLNPEILIVDEVLAVGDAEFQKRCLGKMKDVAQSGRTVLFVSHNMAAIRNLCTRCMLMHRGQLVCDGSVDEAVQFYMTNSSTALLSNWERPQDDKLPSIACTAVACEVTGEQPDHILNVDMSFVSTAEHRTAWIAVEIKDLAGVSLMQAIPSLTGFMHHQIKSHDVQVQITLPPLIPGTYTVSIDTVSHNTEVLDQVREVVTFDILHTPTAGRTFPHGADHGYVVPGSSYTYSPAT